MAPIETIIILMSILVGLNYISGKIRISFPILLVITGLAISLIPGITPISLNPNVVFLIFLPPLLYQASFDISWHDFKRLKTPISGLAIGLVLSTTTMVAICIHYLIPAFSWPLAFLLGAIVSPPDVIAATSATKYLRLPKVITTILEGESLINDASALIAYRYALAAVISGSFSFSSALIKFFLIAGGGITIGLTVGATIYWIHKKINDATIETTISLVAPYASYLLAEHAKVSGVLAVVSTGLFVAWYSSELFTFESRIKMQHFWEIWVFLLNGFVFILIGLQLPKIIHHPGSLSILSLTCSGIIISIVAILARVIWIFPISHLIYYTNQYFTCKKSGYKPKLNNLITVAWSGMRGVVSLAAALAIPITLSNGQEFPMRNEILFITFVVIMITLVIQGFTLPFIVKKLNIEEPMEKLIHDDRTIRLAILNSSLHFIENELDKNIHPDIVDRFLTEYQRRFKYFNLLENQDNIDESQSIDPEIIFQYVKAELAIIEHQRQLIIQMRKNGSFSDDLLRQIEHDIDTWNLNTHTKLRIISRHKPNKRNLTE